MSNRSEAFGRLLKAGIGSIVNCEGKTAPVVEEDLGEQVGVAPNTIQRYKAGHLPPESRTVEILAIACVQRGFMNRDWLQQFLHTARYPTPEKLIDRLIPAGPTRPRPPRIYQNLPAPTYSQFVMRENAFTEVAEGLKKRTAVVLIVGLGGNGKTSLAREVAARCLHKDAVASRFDAVVWVSDKDRSGTTNLSVVLDEIARTLDYPGFTQFVFEEKRWEVEQLLRRQSVLVVVDNFETITDSALLSWLLNLPEPSKALVTTREYRREWRSSWPVELRGMSNAEALTLVEQRLQQLRLERLVSAREQLEPLLQATGGNPKAIELTLGLVKYERRSLQDVVNDLYAARGEIFDDLFARSWALLDEAARRILLAATFFTAGASTEALRATADVQGFVFDRAGERLVDLALLDLQQIDLSRAPRYTLHPLVRAFAAAKLALQPDTAQSMREQWITYFMQFARHAEASTTTNHAELDHLEQELPSLHRVLQACADAQRWGNLIKLVFLLNRVWSFRGYYEDRNRYVDIALRAAEVEGAQEAQVGLLCIQVRTLCYLNEPAQAMACVERARAIIRELNEARHDLERNINYSQVRVQQLLGDYAPIVTLTERNIALSESDHMQHLFRYDLADYYYRVGSADDALQTVQELIAMSKENNDRRGILRGSLLLAHLAMDAHDYAAAQHYLQAASLQADYLHHRRLAADVIRTRARLCLMRDDLGEAREALTEAVDLFERLGMLRELAEARAELAKLEGGASSVS